jgi:predicted nucleic acid-binding Zn ribbon protein
VHNSVDGGDDGAEAPRGVDLARRALEQARAAAKERGVAVGRGGASPRRGAPRTQRSSRRRWSGPGADDRDPQTFASLAAGLVRNLVGADIADHAQPESLVGGELVVRAESTAWASQLRTLQRQILAKIAAGVGHGVVTKLTVRGPAAPSWKHGERTVRGRGPRDTYG